MRASNRILVVRTLFAALACAALASSVEAAPKGSSSASLSGRSKPRVPGVKQASVSSLESPRSTVQPEGRLGAQVPSSGTRAAESPWAISGSIEHYMKHRRDHDAYSVLTLDMGYKFDALNSVRLLQTATKYTVVVKDDAEFLLDDTTVQYTRVLLKDWNGFSIRLRPGLSLPTSRESGKQGIVTRASLSLPVARQFFSKRLTATYTPLYRYQVNRFKTRIGGSPLRKHSLAHTMSLSYALTEKLSAATTAQGQYNWDEQSPYATVDTRPKGSYAFDAGFSYAIYGSVDIGIGYSTSDSFIKDGRYDVNLYDPAAARYYLTLSSTL